MVTTSSRRMDRYIAEHSNVFVYVSFTLEIDSKMLYTLGDALHVAVLQI